MAKLSLCGSCEIFQNRFFLRIWQRLILQLRGGSILILLVFLFRRGCILILLVFLSSAFLQLRHIDPVWFFVHRLSAVTRRHIDPACFFAQRISYKYQNMTFYLHTICKPLIQKINYWQFASKLFLYQKSSYNFFLSLE